MLGGVLWGPRRFSPMFLPDNNAVLVTMGNCSSQVLFVLIRCFFSRAVPVWLRELVGGGVKTACRTDPALSIASACLAQ